MSDLRWERWAAASGIAFVVLAVAAFALASDLPARGSSNDEIAAWFGENETAIGWQTFLFGLAGLALIWFVGTLAASIRRAENDPAGRLPAVIVVSGAVSVALYLGGMAAILAASNAAEALEAGTARILYEVGTGAFLITDFSIIPLVLAVSLAIVRTGLLPVWLAYAGPIYIVLALVDAAGGLLSENDAFGAGGVVGIISFFGFLAWTLVTSTLLMQRAGARAPAPRMAPTG